MTRRVRQLKNRGFTAIELISVLVVLGILAAVAVARMPSMDQAEARIRADVLRTHLRYAQIRAMNAEVPYGIRFNGGTYFLFRDGDPVNGIVRLPSEDSATVSLPAGMNVAAATVSFDSWGRPCTDAAATTLQSGDRTLALTSGGLTENLVITQNTGFIP